MTYDNIKLEHLKDGNIFISYSQKDDELAEKLGYRFLGATKLANSEVHIFEILPLEHCGD